MTTKTGEFNYCLLICKRNVNNAVHKPSSQSSETADC